MKKGRRVTQFWYTLLWLNLVKNLMVTTKVIYLFIFLSRVAIAKSQRMIVMDKFFPNVPA